MGNPASVGFCQRDLAPSSAGKDFVRNDGHWAIYSSLYIALMHYTNVMLIHVTETVVTRCVSRDKIVKNASTAVGDPLGSLHTAIPRSAS